MIAASAAGQRSAASAVARPRADGGPMAAPQALAFGELLKRYRVAAGLTQAQLAERAGLSERAISDLERGARRVPQRATLQLLAGARPALLMAGEPGIGKSRLLAEVAQRAPGWTVLAGGCQRRGGQEPFAPLLGALQGYLAGRAPAQLRAVLHDCAWLVRLLPELLQVVNAPVPAWTLPPEQERRLMFAAVGRFLAHVAGPPRALLGRRALPGGGPRGPHLPLHRGGAPVPARGGSGRPGARRAGYPRHARSPGARGRGVLARRPAARGG